MADWKLNNMSWRFFDLTKLNVDEREYFFMKVRRVLNDPYSWKYINEEKDEYQDPFDYKIPGTASDFIWARALVTFTGRHLDYITLDRLYATWAVLQGKARIIVLYSNGALVWH